MNFIQRVDEVLLGPPFWLGLPAQQGNPSAPKYKFISHVFMLKTETSVLQTLIKEQLNDAFPTGKVKYVVPPKLEYLWLAFIRYDRAEAKNYASKGWLAYTEMLIGFLVRREHTDAINFPPELLTYLGVVYIDDSEYQGQVKDPSAVPIALGREAYGLPKNPGQISYAPSRTNPEHTKCCQLEVWDWDTAGIDKLSLKTAVEVCPHYWVARTPIISGLRRWFGRRPADRRPVRPDFSIIARQFGLDPSVLQIEPTAREHAFRISFPASLEEPPAIAYDNLQWRTKLVGLKQFPDPKNPGQACYQAAVESPLEEKDVPDPPMSVLDPQLLEFPKINRVDLMNRFGIKPSKTQAPREVLVPKERVFSQQGVLLYAKPTEVNVFVP